MPPQATNDWLRILRQKANQRDVYIDTDIDGRIFHFHLGQDPGIIGKVRYSEQESRNYENEQGQKHIWHRYNREKERIQQPHERKVVNITLDISDKDAYDAEEHHFIFLTEQLIQQETYSKGDQKIWIAGDGQYEGPLAEYIDDWDALFEYATTASEPTPTDSGGAKTSETAPEQDRSDTSGTITESSRTSVQVSDRFKREVYDQFGHQCPLSGIEHPDLLTVSHILGRADNPDLAEDRENVVLLAWTQHMAFDADLWTFDESGRVWVHPDFESESSSLRGSLVEYHGQRVDDLQNVADEYIAEHNESLDWWPPR